MHQHGLLMPFVIVVCVMMCCFTAPGSFGAAASYVGLLSTGIVSL